MKANRNLIYDVGLHVGQDTEFYLKKGFRVIAFDANEELCENARDRFGREVKSGRLTIVHAAVGYGDGEAQFFINDKVTEWSSLDKRLGSRGAEAREVCVPMVSVQTAFSEFGVPYYLKIDIEGHDEDPIRGMLSCRVKPVYVSYEASSFAGAALLYAQAYTRFAVVVQNTVPARQLPAPAREGEHVEHRFVMGSSGPFGLEVSEEWGDIDHCLRQHAAWRYLMRGPGSGAGIWADIHAHAPGQARFFETG
jgi:FkbM family methyltransferase